MDNGELRAITFWFSPPATVDAPPPTWGVLRVPDLRNWFAKPGHPTSLLRYHQVVSAHWAAPEGVGSVFKRYLHAAITDGVRPPRASRLGARTCEAIERVANDHPEAAVTLIADAYDAFALEHSGMEIPRVDLTDSVARTQARAVVTRRKRARVR